MRFRRVAVTLSLITVASGAIPSASAATEARSAPSAFELYFGDLHAHTNYSDGEGTPWTAFRAARRAGADFFATTDHVHYPYGPTALTTELWADTLDAARTLTENGRFVAMASYELWLPEVGELNVFDTEEIYGDDGNPAGRGFDNGLHVASREALPRLYDWLAETGAIGQWNHPWLFGSGVSTTPLEEFYGFDFRTPTRDVGIAIVEAYNGGSYADAYVRALDAGWHIMPAANSDTHVADWIAGSEVRTVLLAERLTAAALYDAMRAGRGYATQDSDLAIRYTLDGAVMGSTVAAARTHAAQIRIDDPDGAVDAVTRVDVIADGGVVVASRRFDDAHVTWSASIPAGDASYLFLRVVTKSDATGSKGVTAWTAPVWIDG